jgi:DNA-binding NtrC family response regulator
MLVRILLAISTTTLRQRIQRILAQEEHVVISSSHQKGESLWKALPRQDNDLIVIPRGAIPRPEAEAVSSIHQLPEQPDFIVLTHAEDSAERAHLLAAGCLAVLNERLADEVLQETLVALISRRRNQGLERLRSNQPFAVSHLSDFVSTSPAMQAFMATVQRVVAVDTPLLICGETGVGKERLASAIHAESLRAFGPFIAVNCGALPEGLLESELFGHEEGAFTGATRPRRGYFELAHQGTIFLDEVGEMPLHLQVKLLRVLQERTIQRVGGEKAVPLNVRVIAATNRDLVAEVEARRFRQDLYYRLAVVTLTIPPLRERPEDIPPLVERYIEYFHARLGRGVQGVAAEALKALVRYSWPGNVRELINVIERALLLCASDHITLADLPATITTWLQQNGPTAASWSQPPGLPNDWLNRPWKEVREAVVDALERNYLVGLLKETRGRIRETADRAGIDPRSLYQKMREHGLRKEAFRGK